MLTTHERPRILIVDDNVENLVALEATLGDADVVCVRAQSGEEALSRSLEMDFASILLDVQMPGMDGFETASLLRGSKQTRHIPIIFLTAIHKDFRYALRGYALGAFDYISKPIDPRILKTKVQVFAELHGKNQLIHEQAEQLAQANATLMAEIEVKNRIAEELERSNVELRRFAYVASHDLQEPLRKITTFCQFLAEEYDDRLDETAREWISYIVSGAGRMRALVRDVLAFSRVGGRELAREQVDLSELLSAVLQDLSTPIEESKAVVTVGPLPTVLAERHQLAQLFENLVGNAIKYRGSPPLRVDIEAHREADEWSFSVRDNGIGIEDDYRERIFEVFQRLHREEDYPGTGIGLAICRKIVDEHGGKIWVESRPGEGSVFRFTLSADTMKEVGDAEE